MKPIMRVTCAAIKEEDRYLIVQRGEDTSHALLWEFPGGKVEPNESDEDCMIRELEEELAVTVKLEQKLEVVRREEEQLIIELIPFVCTMVEGELTLLEHEQLAWIDVQAPLEQNLCPGDYFIVEQLKEL